MWQKQKHIQTFCVTTRRGLCLFALFILHLLLKNVNKGNKPKGNFNSYFCVILCARFRHMVEAGVWKMRSAQMCPLLQKKLSELVVRTARWPYSYLQVDNVMMGSEWLILWVPLVLLLQVYSWPCVTITATFHFSEFKAPHKTEGVFLHVTGDDCRWLQGIVQFWSLQISM